MIRKRATVLAAALAAATAAAAVAQPRVVTPGSGTATARRHVVRPDGGARTRFSLCFAGGGYNCVVDGDTIWLQGQKIRIADIDAPETHDPRCSSERALGDRATLRLQELLNKGTVTIESVDRNRDRYGRLLRIVLVYGESVGDVLVREGLARPYAGHRRPWC